MAAPKQPLADLAEEAAARLLDLYINGNKGAFRTHLLYLRSSGTLVMLVVAKLMHLATEEGREDMLRSFSIMLQQNPPRTGHTRVSALAADWRDQNQP